MNTFASDLSVQCLWVARRANRNTILLTCTSGGSAFNLTSYTAIFKVWKYGQESTPAISLTQGAGITNGGAAGTFLIDITELQSTLNPDLYLMKFEVTHPDTTVHCWINGMWQLNGDLYDGAATTAVSVNLNATGTPVNITMNLPGSSVSDASPTTKGIAKLYNTTGTNTDGAMDQNSTTGVSEKYRSHLYFTPSGSNPTLPNAGEASLIMRSDGVTCDAWVRNVSGTTVVRKTATNALLDNWSAGTACTGLPASVRFPTVFQVGVTYYMFIQDQSVDRRFIHLYSSADGLAWTVMNGGSPAITGSATTTDSSNNLYNVGAAVFGTTVYIVVEGNADSGGNNFPANGFYAVSDISSPVWTLTATPQIANVQCCELIYVPEKKAILGIHTEWTQNSNPPSNYYGQTRIFMGNTSQDLTLSESWNKSSLFFASIESPRTLTLAADYSFVLTPGKTYPSMMYYNYNQATGNQAYSKTVTSALDLYNSVIHTMIDGVDLWPSFGRLSLGPLQGNAQYILNVADSHHPQIHFTAADSQTSLNDSGGYLVSAGVSNAQLSAGMVFDQDTGAWISKSSLATNLIYLNAGNMDFAANAVVSAGSQVTPSYKLRVAQTGVSVGSQVAPNSSLHIDGSLALKYAAKTALYTLTATDYAIEVTSGTHTQTLPTAVGIPGREYFITNSGSGTVTLGTTSSQTFVNVTGTPTSLSIGQFHGYVVMSNGANWIVKSSF